MTIIVLLLLSLAIILIGMGMARPMSFVVIGLAALGLLFMAAALLNGSS